MMFWLMQRRKQPVGSKNHNDNATAKMVIEYRGVAVSRVAATRRKLFQRPLPQVGYDADQG
ncbi:hypothetical protein [Burkholderia sp. Nafp2/4-1b]|uniref:hypothetical protein n=1 Tax=Burkholderia sp. Nafp2/4-1b TaxID=2116686 RepID=UPI0013CE685B|nr:hypothetical protein [Burkholderia sp. Nafp2/4-1b]